MMTPKNRSVQSFKVGLLKDSPRSVWKKTEAISVFFLPYLSDKMPQTNPPIATPPRNIISETLLRVLRSHTKSNSEIRVFPKIKKIKK
jgi:hypothetical protein